MIPINSSRLWKIRH